MKRSELKKLILECLVEESHSEWDPKVTTTLSNSGNSYEVKFVSNSETGEYEIYLDDKEIVKGENNGGGSTKVNFLEGADENTLVDIIEDILS
jgi:hypothetical protein